MNILLLGSGGREHALAWKLAQSRFIADEGGTLYAAPGNPGIGQHAPHWSRSTSADHAAVIAFCDRHSDRPRRRRARGAAGRRAGRQPARRRHSRCSGRARPPPSSKAARASPRTCASAPAFPPRAMSAPPRWPRPLRRSTGSRPPTCSRPTASRRARAWSSPRRARMRMKRCEDMFGGAFGAAGAEVVIEEFMEGEEASFFALTDGATIVPFGTAQDHKRVGEGDTGPNTGGMGAYSPARGARSGAAGRGDRADHRPDRAAMAEEGMPYSGVLYAGLMLTAEGPKLVEYNCRFGDPECQVLMMRLESDLGEYLLACGRPAPRLAATAAVFRGCRDDRGDGGEGLSRHARKGRRDRRDRAAPKQAARRSSTPAPRSTGRAPRAPMAGGCSTSPQRGQSVAEAQHKAYAAVDEDRLSQRLLPPRHRLARDRARKRLIRARAHRASPTAGGAGGRAPD